MLPYGGEIVRGNVLGPQGGSVLDPSGDRIDIPGRRPPTPDAGAARAGRRGDAAAAGAARLRLRRRAAARSLRRDAARTGGPVLRHGRAADRRGERHSLRCRIARGRRLRLASAGDDRAVGLRLAERADPDRGPRPGRERCAAVSTSSRALSLPSASSRGTVDDVGGAALASAVVASTVANAVEWIQLSGSDGRYAFPGLARSGRPHRDETLDRRSGERQRAARPGPASASTSIFCSSSCARRWSRRRRPPAPPAVPVGIEPVIQFSEAVERASLAAAITLRPSGGDPLAFAIHHQGSQVTLEPEVSLEPETTYELSHRRRRPRSPGARHGGLGHGVVHHPERHAAFDRRPEPRAALRAGDERRVAHPGAARVGAGRHAGLRREPDPPRGDQLGRGATRTAASSSRSSPR